MPLIDHTEHVQATHALLEEQQERAAKELFDRLNQESVSTESLVEARLSAVKNKAHESNQDVFEGQSTDSCRNRGKGEGCAWHQR